MSDTGKVPPPLDDGEFSSFDVLSEESQEQVQQMAIGIAAIIKQDRTQLSSYGTRVLENLNVLMVELTTLGLEGMGSPGGLERAQGLSSQLDNTFGELVGVIALQEEVLDLLSADAQTSSGNEQTELLSIIQELRGRRRDFLSRLFVAWSAKPTLDNYIAVTRAIQAQLPLIEPQQNRN